MPVIVVNDASCLIDLRKGRLLRALCHLPFRFVVPLSVRESELLDFSPDEWAILDHGGMETHDLPPERMADALALKRRFGRLSASFGTSTWPKRSAVGIRCSGTGRCGRCSRKSGPI